MTVATLRIYWSRAFFLSTAFMLAACSSSSPADHGGAGVGSGGTASTNSGGRTGGSGAAGASSGGSTTSAGGTTASAGGTTTNAGGTTASAGGTTASAGGTTTSAGGTTTSAGGTTKPGGSTANGGSAGGGTSSGGVTNSGGATKTGGSTGTAGSVGGTTSMGGANSGGTAKTGGSGAAGGTSGGTTGSGGTSGGGATTVTGLPAASAVLASMHSANDWFMNKHPDPGADIVTDKTRSSNLWTRATYYEGLMALYNVEPDATKKTSYHDYAVSWGTSHSWALYDTPATNADNQACGQVYIELYNIDKKANYITAIKAGIDSMVASPPTGTSGWWWIDAIHMSMPSFAKLGVLYPTGGYFDGMWTMYNQARSTQGGGLWNATDGLWYRDLHYTPSGGTKTPMTAAIHNNLTNGTPDKSTDAYYVAPNGKSLYWSRGNGWVVAALVRVLDILPTTDSHRATYVSDFQAMAKALIAVQRTDGFWNESLFDPTHCATIGLTGDDGPETSGTDFFVYGLAWGIRKGLLDSATYGAAMQKGWNGLSTVALQSNGLLGYTQSSGDRPCTEDTQNPGPLGPTKLANFDDYGVGGFLLAGSEVYQLASP